MPCRGLIGCARSERYSLGRTRHVRIGRRLPDSELFARVEAAPEIRDRIPVREVVPVVGGRQVSLVDREEVEIGPGEEAGLSSVSASVDELLGGKVDAPRLAWLGRGMRRERCQ
jgi:hypothetical protein